jgi:5-methylcytosine-specific restriction protein B
MKRSGSAEELGAILADMYKSAPPKGLVTTILLFGIQYHDAIRAAGPKKVVEASGIGDKYHAEVNKGINLAEYVIPKYPRQN